MGMEDAESCSSTGPVATLRRDRLKYDVYTKVLRRVRDQPEALLPGFAEDLWAHFSRLPPRYSIDFNVDRAEDVFTHMKLLKLAVDPANRPVFHIKVVQASSVQEGVTSDSASSNPPGEEHPTNKTSVHPMPMFGSSSNLEALALESREPEDNDGLSVSNGNLWSPRPMHEITFSADDRPKMLSQLTSLLGELGLNIQEAHAFSTNDGYSLDAFVVQGWRYEETEQLEKELQLQIQKTMPLTKPCSLPNLMEQVIPGAKPVNGHVKIPTDGSDVWEINFRLLKIENKVASGSYSDLYKGTYLNQDVAIKVLAPERVNAEMQREFCQEVFIMRKVRHKNVVQFIGACTKPPLFCIVTEFMAGGSVYDFLHKNKGVLNLSSLIRIATDISRGMNYLHQNNIIHRDLKAANLLIDEHQLVKVADFGVARVKSRSGIMTAETGTYRWMAPEVIEHKPYDHKADVFSFAIVLWELLTRQIPYEQYTPLQAAVGVVQKGLRPTIPEKTHPKLSQLLQRCWEQDPSKRPDFSEIIKILQQLAKEVKEEPDSEGRLKEKSSGRFLAALRRSH